MRLDQVFFYLLLVFLPTQLGLHVWPDWAMVLGRRVDYLSPTLYVTDILILFLLIFYFLNIHFKLKISNLKFEIKRRKFKILIIFLLILFVLLNILFTSSSLVALYHWAKVVEFFLLGFYIVQTKPKTEKIIFFLSIGVLYSSVLGILQFIFQRSLGLWVLGERTFTTDTPGIAKFVYQNFFRLRAYATFPHPNVLAGFLAATLVLILNFKFEIPASPAGRFNQKKKFLMYKIMTVTLGFFALIVTFSRSAWVAITLGLGKFFIPLSIILLLLVGRTIGPGDESVFVRDQLNQSAIAMVSRSPFVGVGLGNYLVNLPKFLVARDIYFLQPAHNIYLLLLSETGAIGLVLFLLLCFRALQKKSVYRPSLVILLLLGLVDHYVLTLQQGQILLTLFLSLSLIQ